MPVPHALRCSPRSGHRPSPGYPIRARPSPRPWRARGCRTGTARRRRRSGSRTLHEFDERSPEGGGVGEPDATAPRPGASMFVDDPTASFPDAREGRVHARDMEGEVVDARPTAFEELGHRGAGVGRLEQLDMRLPDRDEGYPDPIGGDVLWRTLRRTDERSPLLDGGREVRHRDADMVELQFDPSGQNARDGVCSPNRRRQTSATSPSDAPATTLASTYGRTFSSAPVAASRRSSVALRSPFPDRGDLLTLLGGGDPLDRDPASTLLGEECERRVSVGVLVHSDDDLLLRFAGASDPIRLARDLRR